MPKDNQMPDGTKRFVLDETLEMVRLKVDARRWLCCHGNFSAQI
jgi:hypothetical protein